MPELPDVTVYVDALRERVVGQPLSAYAILSPFILRTVDPPLDAAVGRQVGSVVRLGKHIVFGFNGDLTYANHLIIPGRFIWIEPGHKGMRPSRSIHDQLQLPNGGLGIT